MQAAIPPALTPRTPWSLKGFAALLAVMLVFAGVLTALVAPLLRMGFLAAYSQALFVLGLAYVVASVLAWTGFANLYRYSPTLFAGSRSYRQRITKGEMYREGRDEESLLIGSLFGLSLIGLGGLAGLLDPEGASWISAVALGAVALAALAAARLWSRRRKMPTPGK